MAMMDERRHQQAVLLEDLTAVIDVLSLAAFAVAIGSVASQHMSISSFAHALSLVLLVSLAGHYLEAHVFGTEGVRDMVLSPTRWVCVRDGLVELASMHSARW